MHTHHLHVSVYINEWSLCLHEDTYSGWTCKSAICPDVCHLIAVCANTLGRSNNKYQNERTERSETGSLIDSEILANFITHSMESYVAQPLKYFGHCPASVTIVSIKESNNLLSEALYKVANSFQRLISNSHVDIATT